MLDEIFMWLKKPSLLKFNKKVATTWLVEAFGCFKTEARTISKGKAVGLGKDTGFLHQTVIIKPFFVQSVLVESHVLSVPC